MEGSRWSRVMMVRTREGEEEFEVKNDHHVFFTLAIMLVQFTEMKTGGSNLHGKMTFRHVGFEVPYEIIPTKVLSGLRDRVWSHLKST